MAAWQSASTPSNESAGRGQWAIPSWPHSVVRWLFGMGEEPDRAPAPSAPIARFQNICISREAGAGAGALARMVGERLGWKVYDEELIEAIAHRMGLPLDDVRALDEQAPSMVQDWLLPLREEYYAPQEAYLDHLAKLDRGDRPRGRIDPGRTWGRLHAAARDDVVGPRDRAAQGPGAAAGRADGGVGPNGPPCRPRP